MNQTTVIEDTPNGPCARVRIPIAINEAGEWFAENYHDRTLDSARQEVERAAAEIGLGNVAIHWATVLVPLPRSLVLDTTLE